MESLFRTLSIRDTGKTADEYGYLEAPKRLRHHMILVKLGYRDRTRAMPRMVPKNRYPEVHEVFESELGNLWALKTTVASGST